MLQDNIDDQDSFRAAIDSHIQDDEDEEVPRHADNNNNNNSIDPTILGRQNFYFGKTLGEGSFARVVHAKMKTESSPEFAIKIMEKSHIHKEKKVDLVMMEKRILSTLSFPFIIKLYYTFHDEEYLYMCMDLAAGGELLKLIHKHKQLNELKNIKDTACDKEMTQFYMAELVCALEYLHLNNIIHMDLKPENVLITKDGHIKVADFGTALIHVDGVIPESVFVGTAQYVSPEILNEDHNISIACDLWALGCIIYQMLCGQSPFQADTEYLIFQAINNHLDGSVAIPYPASILSINGAKEVVESLLKKDPAERLGAGGCKEGADNNYTALKSHAFFSGIEWTSLSDSTPPFIPDAGELPDSENMQDGAFDDWILEGDATLLDFAEDAAGGGNNSDDELQMLSKSRKGATKWDKFLLPNKKETVLFSGLTWKRKGLFSKKRQLILTDQPRLIYVDPDAMEEKGQIPWTLSKPLKCVPLRGNAFDIVCTSTGRSYHFTDAGVSNNSSPLKWADLINDMNKRLKA